MSYEDVASATHVRPHVIKSIENGTIEETTAPIYARGFMKTYCDYLMAADLWRKYSLGIPQTDEQPEENFENEPVAEEIKIKHPTPMFRRTSIIWVYIILVIAVVGAAYLLWSQSRQPGGTDGAFPLNQPDANTGGNVIEAPLNEIIIAMPLPEDTADETSQTPADEEAAENPNGAITPGDISWMDDTSASVTPIVEAPQIVDRALLIEITGSNTRLVVRQDGRNVTQRSALGIGASRTYTVNSDTRVTIGAGNRARVTWNGNRYDPVGSDNAEIVLTFHPDGTVTRESGNSPHFAGAP